MALDCSPRFTKVLLFELEGSARRLERILQADYPGRDITVYAGDCNITIDQALVARERATAHTRAHARGDDWRDAYVARRENLIDVPQTRSPRGNRACANQEPQLDLGQTDAPMA